MADKTEKVEYVFEGNVSSLRDATQTAIQLLNKYSDSMKRASASDNFGASKRSAQSMNASINRLIRDVDKMQSKLKTVGDVKLPTGSAAAKTMESTLAAVTSQMQKLNSTDSITTKTLTGFRAQLEGVRSALQSTSPQVDRLVSSEQRFQNILSTVQNKADSFRNTMDSMRSKITGAFEPIAGKIRSISSVFDKITAKIQSFKDKAETTFSRVGQLSNAVSSAFRRTSQGISDSDNAVSRSATSHKTFGNILSKLTSKTREEISAIDKEKDQLNSKNSTVKKSTSEHGKLFQAVANLGQKFKTETSKLKIFNSNLSIVRSTTGAAKNALEALTGIKLGDWLSQAAHQAITFTENLNLFTVAMGDSADKGHEFVAAMQEVYGMDPSNLYRYTGYFYQLTAAIGMAGDASATLSLSLTKAANDIASLFNADIATVVNNLAAGMQGMSRAVRKYGIDIRATTLQQTALKYGITESVNTMSEANRMALRYITIMEQVSSATNQLGTDINGNTTAMGDFARTIETPANQLRIFKEQITQLGRAIGNFLVAPLKQVIAYINGFIMALRMAINFVAGLFGFLDTSVSDIDTSGAEDASDALDSIGTAAGSAAEKVKDLAAPFDELNILQEQAASGGGGGAGGTFDDLLDPALEEAIAEMELKIENIRMKANEVRDAILRFFGFKIDAGQIISWDPDIFEENLIEKFPQWTKTIKAAFDNWSGIVSGFKKVFGALIKVVKKAKEKVLDFFKIFINDDTVSSFITNLSTNLDSLAGWITAHEDTLANLAIALTSIYAAFKAFKGLSVLAGVFSSLGVSVGALLEVVAIVAAAAAAVYLLYTNSESFATSITDLFDTFVEGLRPIVESFIGLITTIGESFASMWDTHIKPTIGAIGDAIAPVLDTLGELWLDVSEIISDAFDLISELWTETLQPVLEDLFLAVQNVCGIFEELWEEVIGPVVEYIGDGIRDLWYSTLKPIFRKLWEAVSGIIDIALELWNEVLSPLLGFLVDSLGPSVKDLLKDLWDAISQFFEDLGGVFDGLLTTLNGLIDFIAGVFSGDWERAWKGVVNILVGIGNLIISVFELALNAVISIVNLAISFIWNAIVGLVNLILGAVEGIASWFGADWDIQIDSEPWQIPTIDFPRIPEMASGGIVTSPTYLLAGEGRYDEAIIPLGNSPQMEELVQRIADAVDKPDNKPSGNTPIEVRVFIGGDEYDAFTYRAAERGRKKVGAQPVTTGG